MAYEQPVRKASNPTVNDDASRGYLSGRIWINTATAASYISVDSTVGAAVWNLIAIGTVGLSTLPIGSVYWTGNAVATVITTQNTWTRVAPVAGTLAASTVGFDRPANGRLRFIQTPPASFGIGAMLSFSSASPNEVFIFGIWKNGGVNANDEYTSGAQVAGSTIRLKTGGAGDYQSSGVNCLDNAVTNDYYELAVQNTTSTGDLTIADASVLAFGHPT